MLGCRFDNEGGFASILLLLTVQVLVKFTYAARAKHFGPIRTHKLHLIGVFIRDRGCSAGRRRMMISQRCIELA